MAESTDRVRLRISPAIARFLAPGTSSEARLQGIADSASLNITDRVTLLFCLVKAQEPEIRTAARTAISALTADEISQYTALPDSHPQINEVLLKRVAPPQSEPQAREPLPPVQSVAAPLPASSSPPIQEPLRVAEPGDYDDPCEQFDEDEGNSDRESEEEDEESFLVSEETDGEEYMSKFKLATQMGIADKIKMGLTGDKEWRGILIKDANKLVSGAVMKNPRITEGEVLTVLKSGIQNDEIMRLICANKEWVKNYKIRKALVENPRTPLANALRFLSSLNEKDISGYAKSKNVSSVISTQAKRILASKKKG